MFAVLGGMQLLPNVCFQLLHTHGQVSVWVKPCSGRFGEEAPPQLVFLGSFVCTLPLIRHTQTQGGYKAAQLKQPHPSRITLLNSPLKILQATCRR